MDTKNTPKEEPAPDTNEAENHDPSKNTWNDKGPWKKHIPTGEEPERSGGADDVNENTRLRGSE